MKPTTIIICLFLVTCSPLFGESLWNPESGGLFTGKSAFQVGDVISVSINSGTSLSYTSTQVDNESITLEISGGEAGNLFSFLPAGSSGGSQNLRGGESLSIEAGLSASIVDIDENGQLILQGSRTFFVHGRQESITLSGSADPSLVGENRTIPLEMVADARLVYRTLLQSPTPVLAAGDLEILREPIEPVGAEVLDGEEDQTEERFTESLAITENRQRELLLLYLNRLIDMLFQQ